TLSKGSLTTFSFIRLSADFCASLCLFTPRMPSTFMHMPRSARPARLRLREQSLPRIHFHGKFEPSNGGYSYDQNHSDYRRHSHFCRAAPARKSRRQKVVVESNKTCHDGSGQKDRNCHAAFNYL